MYLNYILHCKKDIFNDSNNILLFWNNNNNTDIVARSCHFLMFDYITSMWFIKLCFCSPYFFNINGNRSIHFLKLFITTCIFFAYFTLIKKLVNNKITIFHFITICILLKTKVQMCNKNIVK